MALIRAQHRCIFVLATILVVHRRRHVDPVLARERQRDDHQRAVVLPGEVASES